jgi:[ribosomal protein S5]-alanine N-acetyltransferase
MEIETKRFLLRDFIPADEPAFFAYRSDPRYAEFCTAAEVTPNFSQELLQRFTQWAVDNPRCNYQLAIVDRRWQSLSFGQSRQLIGCGGLRRDRITTDRAEIGIELAPQFWGRYAYAIEITQALIEFGFRTLDLKTIYGISIGANLRVTKLAQYCGFVAIDTHLNPEWMQEKEWDRIEWQLTRSAWELKDVKNAVRATGKIK